MSRELGQDAEDLACQYLQSQGLRLLERNYYCRIGEIDLIMQDNDSLVFVEVRARANDDYGGAASSITLAKKRRIIRTCQHYLVWTQKYDKIACRIDVVLITGSKPDIEWIKNAM